LRFCVIFVVSDIAVFVLKRDVKPTNSVIFSEHCSVECNGERIIKTQSTFGVVTG